MPLLKVEPYVWENYEYIYVSKIQVNLEYPFTFGVIIEIGFKCREIILSDYSIKQK